MRLIALYGVLAVNLFAADVTPFDYDRSLPLDPHEREISVLNGTRVALLNFAVTPSMRADGLLVTPTPGKAKAGAIVWVHSSGATTPQLWTRQRQDSEIRPSAAAFGTQLRCKVLRFSHTVTESSLSASNICSGEGQYLRKCYNAPE